MSEIKRILDQLKRSMEGKAWHGPSISEVLANINSDKAAAHPISAAHSIWEITDHVAAWMHFVSKRLEGEPIEPTPEQDWPMIAGKDEKAWDQTKQRLEKSYRDLSSEIAKLKDDDLEQTFIPGKPYTFYLLLHGVIQHNLFHAGQISLLRKG